MSSGALTPRELAAALAQGERYVLLDVREPDEFAICRLAGSINLPLGDLHLSLVQLDRAAPTVCICHHGIRSAHAVAALVRLGFANVQNLSGGVERWALEVERAMPRY